MNVETLESVLKRVQSIYVDVFAMPPFVDKAFILKPLADASRKIALALANEQASPAAHKVQS